jgi:sterol desaturase/sphingolipid hydroxylase (fatty acid hydroxylase superfamily)
MSPEPADADAQATATASDEERWAQAQSILDRAPTASASQRLRRARRNRWLLVIGLVVVGIALAVAVAFLLGDEAMSDAAEVSTARTVAGFTLSGLGLLLMVVGLFWQIRAVRRARGFGSPLHVLTRRQQKELLEQVRGRSPVQPVRVPLARHLAELLQVQQLSLVPLAGLLVNFVGLWIAMPATWRLVTMGIFAPLILLAAVLLRRQSRQVRRFLAAYPAPSTGVDA